ncbi:hypothetical protein ACF09J_07840 [Streptomyces sp. NPDC014889]
MTAYGLALGITAGPFISAALLGLRRAGCALRQLTHRTRSTS